MKFLGNILWLVLGGLLVSLYYFLVGILFCITIIGIPFGLQLIKMAGFALWPFGHEVQSDTNDGGCLSIIMNVIWILVGGVEIALFHVTAGAILCLTIVGIPFGLQHFKMALLALIPFGKKIS
ncbi:MAG: YccF domain-containing protein [Bacteroidales bacterium]|nr:YccF domain-containing protein [Bacteroidales bacterium]